MSMKQVKRRERSVLKGALAGLVGGIAGSGAKAVAEKIYPPLVSGETNPQVALAERFTGRPLTGGESQIAQQGIHWTLGALAGALYGAAVELEPKAGVWRGAAFGLALNKLTQRGLIPQAGRSEPPARQSIQDKQSAWLTHVVYGFSTDVVRRMVRKRL